VAAGYEMRVSDAEREAAASELREHFASGRLNQDELDERLTAVFAAKTRGDLQALFTDLPSSGHGWASASAPAGGRAYGSIGSGGPWTTATGASDDYSGWQSGGGGWRATAGRGVGRILATSVLVWVLLAVGFLGVFGIGTGRPFGIVLILAAFALLRRLLFMIFGRRRGGGGRGRRGGRGGRGPRRRR
jgi:Domain of unknown function (DUF1707)